MKTVNDLIKELQQLKPSLRKLPIVIQAENGMLFNPVAKILAEKFYVNILDDPKKMIMTYE